jgi:hypothetical protein
MILEFVKNIFSSNNEESNDDDLKKLFEKKDDKKDKKTGEKEKTNDEKKAEKDWLGQRVYDDDGEKVNTVISMLSSCLNPTQWTSSNFKLPNFHTPKATPLDLGTIKRIQNAKENEQILLSSVQENTRESKSNNLEDLKKVQKELKSSNVNTLSKAQGQYK